MKKFPDETSSADLDSATQKALAAVARACRQIEEDNEALRQREANLREYEARLRAWQGEMDRWLEQHGAPPAPASAGQTEPAPRRASASDEPTLLNARDKFQRAREILEAEQSHLVNDRLLLQEQAVALHQREAALNAREHHLAEREAHVDAALLEHPPAGASRNPLGLARMLLRAKAS